MKTLNLYLLRQVITTLLMTVLIFTFVFVLGNVFKEVLAMLVNGQVSLAIAFEAVGLLIPFAIAYALPMGLLTAVLLVFGRFSADLELTAARAGGVSLVSLAAPVLVLSLGLSALSAWANLELGPSARIAFKRLLFKYTSEITVAQIPEGRPIKDIPGYIVSIGKNRNGKLENVQVYRLGQESKDTDIWVAPRGIAQIENTGTNRLAVLHLFNVRGVLLEGDQSNPVAVDQLDLSYDLSQWERSWSRTPIGDMSFTQLRAELRAIKERVGEQSLDQDASQRERFIANQVAKLTSPVKVEMHRQWAFSFACFGFALVGIPLGIRVQRRETNIGFAIAIGLVVIYYALVMLGLSLDQHPEYAPHLLLWLPNFLFQGVGAFLLWRANRGF